MENRKAISRIWPTRVYRWLNGNREALCWIAALVLLYCMPASVRQRSLCPSSLLGIGECPGCGIGHAIHYALHLQPAASFRHHFMGIPAVLIIFSRIIRLLYSSKHLYEAQSR